MYLTFERPSPPSSASCWGRCVYCDLPADIFRIDASADFHHPTTTQMQKNLALLCSAGSFFPPIRSSARTDNGRIADGQRFLQDTPLMRTQIRSPFLNTTHDFLEDPWLSHRLFQLLRNRLLKPPLLMKVCVCDFPPSRYYTLDLMCEGCPWSGRKY